MKYTFQIMFSESPETKNCENEPFIYTEEGLGSFSHFIVHIVSKLKRRVNPQLRKPCPGFLKMSFISLIDSLLYLFIHFYNPFISFLRS